MTVKALPIVLLVFSAAFTSIATMCSAMDSSDYTMEDVTACSPDAMRICKDKLPDLDQIQECMKANFEKLRPACKARFEKKK